MSETFEIVISDKDGNVAPQAQPSQGPPKPAAASGPGAGEFIGPPRAPMEAPKEQTEKERERERKKEEREAEKARKEEEREQKKQDRAEERERRATQSSAKFIAGQFGLGRFVQVFDKLDALTKSITQVTDSALNRIDPEKFAAAQADQASRGIGPRSETAAKVRELAGIGESGKPKVSEKSQKLFDKADELLEKTRTPHSPPGAGAARAAGAGGKAAAGAVAGAGGATSGAAGAGGAGSVAAISAAAAPVALALAGVAIAAGAAVVAFESVRSMANKLAKEFEGLNPRLAIGSAQREQRQIFRQLERADRFADDLNQFLDAQQRIGNAAQDIGDDIRQALLQQIIPLMQAIAAVVEFARDRVDDLEEFSDTLVYKIITQGAAQMVGLGVPLAFWRMAEAMDKTEKNTRKKEDPVKAMVDQLLNADPLTQDQYQGFRAPQQSDPFGGGIPAIFE